MLTRSSAGMGSRAGRMRVEQSDSRCSCIDVIPSVSAGMGPRTVSITDTPPVRIVSSRIDHGSKRTSRHRGKPMTVHTVLGPIDATALGPTSMHEHILSDLRVWSKAPTLALPDGVEMGPYLQGYLRWDALS